MTKNAETLFTELDAVDETDSARQAVKEDTVLYSLEEDFVSSQVPSTGSSKRYATQVNEHIINLAHDPVTALIMTQLDAFNEDFLSWDFIHLCAIRAQSFGLNSDGLGDIASAVNYLRKYSSVTP